MGSLGGERSNDIAAAGNDSSAASDGIGATLQNVTDVLRTMRELNEAQTVRNEEIFGPVTNETVVIAIQGLMIRLFYVKCVTLIFYPSLNLR